MEEQNTNYVMNPGAYDMYPDFLVTPAFSQFSISHKDNVVYDYVFNFYNTKLNIIGRNGLVSYNGRIAETVLFNNIELVNSSINNGTLAIESGRPELLKCHIKDVQDLTLAGTADKTQSVRLITLSFDTDTKYARSGLTAYHLFASSSSSLTYGSGSYPVLADGTAWQENFNIETIAFTVNSFLVQSGSLYVLAIPLLDIVIDYSNATENDNDDDSLKLKTAISKYDNLYLSICDADSVQISDNTSGYITLQTRDAF